MPVFNQNLQWIYAMCLLKHENIRTRKSFSCYKYWGKRRERMKETERKKFIEKEIVCLWKHKCRSFVHWFTNFVVCVGNWQSCRLKSIELKSSKATTVLWKIARRRKAWQPDTTKPFFQKHFFYGITKRVFQSSVFAATYVSSRCSTQFVLFVVKIAAALIIIIIVAVECSIFDTPFFLTCNLNEQ